MKNLKSYKLFENLSLSMEAFIYRAIDMLDVRFRTITDTPYRQSWIYTYFERSIGLKLIKERLLQNLWSSEKNYIVISLLDGYRKYCCDKCVKDSDEYYTKWLSSWQENNKDGKYLVKRESAIIKKYGNLKDYNIMVQENREKSMIDKYGVTNSFQIPDIKKQRKKSLKEKYGSETFNNPDKTKNTRISNKTQIDDSIIDDFLSYKTVAINRTSTIYRNNKEIVNPNKLKRGKKEYHLDHIYSIKQGFLNNIPLSIITHPCNLHLIHYKENLIKQDSCWISKEDLLGNIINYTKDIKVNHSILKEEYSNIKEVAKNLKNSN